MRQDNAGIAIVGRSFTLPGAQTTAQWHEMLYSAQDALSASGVISELPGWVNRAGYVEHWRHFDYRLFGLSLRDSLIIDPQHRLFIQNSWQALEVAGYNPLQLPGRVGVFSTASDTSYAEMIKHLPGMVEKYQPFEMEVASNKEQQSMRLSYLLNLKGPSFLVQSACSSGLLVVHVAQQALGQGACDVAIVGGACLPFPLHRGYRYREGMNLSRRGRVCSFDRDADGMVPGFGCIVFILKRMADAIRDRDMIYAEIEASAVNNDGRHKAGYTAPSSHAVAENLCALLQAAGVRAAEVDLIEAHGSGTKIGDVIEAAALRRVFAGCARAHNTVPLSSVKAMIGHLDTVAGLAGLLRATTQLSMGRVAPAANFSQLNPKISLAGSPLYVPSQAVPLQGSCRAIVNAMGIGGTNCALLLRSAPSRPGGGRCGEYCTAPCLCRGGRCHTIATNGGGHGVLSGVDGAAV